MIKIIFSQCWVSKASKKVSGNEDEVKSSHMEKEKETRHVVTEKY